MIKVKIVFDEEKILREKKYNLEKMWKVIDAAFTAKNIRTEAKGLYVGTNHPHDYANFGVVCIALGKEDWFLDNVVEWKFYINDTSENEEDFYEEDFLKETKYYKVGFR